MCTAQKYTIDDLKGDALDNITRPQGDLAIPTLTRLIKTLIIMRIKINRSFES